MRLWAKYSIIYLMNMGRIPEKKTILVVDDEELVTEVIRSALTEMEYRCLTCNDPYEALNLFSQSPEGIDIVIVDEIMPGMRGTDLTMRLLRIKDDLPVILITGHGHLIPLDDVRRAGIREVLVKPVSMEKLKTTVEKVLSTKRRTASLD